MTDIDTASVKPCTIYGCKNADTIDAQAARIAELEEVVKAYQDADSCTDDDRLLMFMRADRLARALEDRQ